MITSILTLLGYEGKAKYKWVDFDASIKREFIKRLFILLLLLAMCFAVILFSPNFSYMGMTIPRFIILIIPIAYLLSILTYYLQFAYEKFDIYRGVVSSVEIRDVKPSKKGLLSTVSIGKSVTASIVDADDNYYFFSCNGTNLREGMEIAIYTPKRSVNQKDVNTYSIINISAITIIDQNIE